MVVLRLPGIVAMPMFMRFGSAIMVVSRIIVKIGVGKLRPMHGDVRVEIG